MATATSAVSAALDGLLYRINNGVTVTRTPLVLTNAGLLNGDQIWLLEGPPAAQNQPTNMIVVDQVQQRAEPHNMRGDMGSGFLREDFDILINCSSYIGGDNMTLARQSVATLVKLVHDAVRNDPTLNGALNGAAWPADNLWSVQWQESFVGVLGVCEMKVSCFHLA